MKKNKLERKKLIEKFAVQCFLKNEGVSFDEFDIVSGEENGPVDAIYKYMNFQITTAPAEVEEVVGRLDKEKEVKSGNVEGRWVKFGQTETKTWDFGYNIEESFRGLILNPIEKKCKQYGKKSTPKALKDIIFLIYCHNLCVGPWSDKLWEDFRKDNMDYFIKTGFKSIYLIDSDKNIKIYP